MELIRDYDALSAAITAHMRPGMATNSTLKAGQLRREVAAGTLSAHQWPGGLLLLRRREGHHILNFYLTDRTVPLDIALPSPTVAELPLRPRDGEEGADYWTALGFRPVLRRVRLARTPLGGEPAPSQTPTLSPKQAMDILTACFDPLTGCLPTRLELEEDMARGRVLTAGEFGLLRLSLDRTAEIRQLAVLPQARGQGVAGRLVEGFNTRTAHVRATVWTGADNLAAQHIYQAHGFAPDGWRGLVLGNY